MNEDTIRDIYYVEHKWNPHFSIFPQNHFARILKKMAPIYTLTCSTPCIRKSLIIFVHIRKTIFSLRKELCNNGTTIIYQLITPSPVLSPLPGVSISAVN